MVLENEGSRRGIAIGEEAPEIRSKAWFPERKDIADFRLSDHKGKWIVLAFYPGDFTFVCATDIEELMKSYGRFSEANAEIFGISTDSIYSHKAWSETSPRVKESKIPLIDDFKKGISADYGFLNAESGAARRGSVIIDPEMRIQYFSVHNDALGKDVEHLLNALMGLKYIHDTTPSAEGHICAVPANWRVGKKALDIDIVNDIGKL